MKKETNYCECEFPNNLGYIDTMLNNICGNCEKGIKPKLKECDVATFFGVKKHSIYCRKCKKE